MLKLAFIGNGKSTNRYHIPFIQTLPELFRIKTIYTRSEPKWPAVDGVIYTRNLQDIWGDQELDLVVITTPLTAHYPLAKEALDHGKNVLLEKPFTETEAQARELFDLAKSRGLLIQAYQNRRFDSDFLTVQEVIRSGKLGDLLELEMHFDYFRPEIPEGEEHFSLDTSYLYGHACHTVDQVLSYFGQPGERHLEVRSLLGQGRMNDYFDLDFFYPYNFKVSIKSSYFRIKPRPSFVIYGTRGMFVKESKDRQEEHLKLFYMPENADFGLDLPEHYGSLTYVDSEGTYHEEKVPTVSGNYSQYYLSLYETLAKGGEKLVKDEDTLYQISLLEAGIKLLEEKNEH